MKAGSRPKKAEVMLRSIQKIGQDMSDNSDVVRTKDITEQLKANRKRIADMLSSSYDEAFNIAK